MIHAATPAVRIPLRLPLYQPLAMRKAALEGWFGRRVRPLMAEVEAEEPQPLFWGLTVRDAKEFLMAYSAAFMVVVAFFA